MDKTLHGWVYDIVCGICRDREYLYRCFVKNFGDLLRDIFSEGAITGAGELVAAGIKSDSDAVFRWRLARRADLVGQNTLEVTCAITPKSGGEPTECRTALFDLSTGEQLPEPGR